MALKEKNKAWVLGIVLIVLIGLLIYFTPCPTESQYIYFRIILSIAIAGLAVMIPGFFEIKYKTLVTAGGALGVFALTYLVNPAKISSGKACEDRVNISIFLQDKRGAVPTIQDAGIKLQIGGSTWQQPWLQQGRVTFENIPTSLLDDTAYVYLEGKDWQFTNGKVKTTFFPITESKTYVVERDRSLCCLHGSVRTEENKFVPGAEVRALGAGVTTNASGEFMLELPADKQAEEVPLTAFKDGYKLYEMRVSPRSEINIVLKK